MKVRFERAQLDDLFSEITENNYILIEAIGHIEVIGTPKRPGYEGKVSYSSKAGDSEVGIAYNGKTGNYFIIVRDRIAKIGKKRELLDFKSKLEDNFKDLDNLVSDITSNLEEEDLVELLDHIEGAQKSLQAMEYGIIDYTYSHYYYPLSIVQNNRGNYFLIFDGEIARIGSEDDVAVLGGSVRRNYRDTHYSSWDPEDQLRFEKAVSEED